VRSVRSPVSWVVVAAGGLSIALRRQREKDRVDNDSAIDLMG
jgi:hypothetical protein